MECARIEERLSEYVDDVLDGETKALVDKHLSTCERCQEEFASLKALIKELGSLESVEAPRDFLERVHERMEPRFGLRQLIRWLFVPVRIKVPLEFATAAAIAMLIFYVSTIGQRETRIARAPNALTPLSGEREGALDTVETKLKGELGGPRLALEEEQARQRDRGREPVQLALVLEKERFRTADEPSAGMEADQVPEKPATMANEEAFEVFRPEVKKQAAGVTQNVALSKVSEVIRRAGGKVISIEDEAEADQAKSVRAEIPADRYNAFVENLREIAPFHSPPPTVSETGRESVQIRIRFISPK